MYTLFCYFDYKGIKYNVLLNRSTRCRRVTYRFKKGHIEISSPNFVSKTFLIDGLKRNAPYLIELDLSKEKPYDQNYVYFLGDKIPFNDGFVTIFGKTFLFLSIENFYNRIKDLVLPLFIERTRIYENKMGINNAYNVALRYKESNYGVNSRKTHTITYNISLIHYSVDIIDSLVVHELAHHFVFNHSKSFYNVVYKYMPDYNVKHKKLTKRVYK